MAAFLGQYYVSSPERDLPSELIVNVVHEDFPTLIEAIHALRGRELDISHRVRGTRARWQQLAVTNAEQGPERTSGESTARGRALRGPGRSPQP